jgi:ribonuclease P protein component
MERLRRRADFLAAASGRKIATAAFLLQARERAAAGPARVGFTVSKKVGTAVERNRVRRRLKDVIAHSADGRLLAGHDYVLIGRRAALQRPFERMAEELQAALRRLESGPRAAKEQG